MPNYKWFVPNTTADLGSPIRAFWEMAPDAKCIDDGLSLEVTAILNTLSEFVLAVLPMMAVFRLKVAKNQRWSVITALSLGLVVGIVGIVRTYYVFLTSKTFDLTWYSTPLWVTAEVEINLSLVCFMFYFINHCPI
jgi:hypothetical protein